MRTRVHCSTITTRMSTVVAIKGTEDMDICQQPVSIAAAAAATAPSGA